MPSISVDGITFRRALSLSNSSLGRVFRAIAQALYDGKTEDFDLEGVEVIYFQILYDYAVNKANVWYLKTNDSSSNNHKKTRLSRARDDRSK